ncbi:DNA-binding protein [Yersinia enterocolitica]|nr:DNA-binding protein [Yersinia enterocolitica]
MSDGLRDKLKKLRLGKTENNGVKPFVQAYQSLGLEKETELADLMAANRSTINKYLNDKVSVPAPAVTLAALLRYLQIRDKRLYQEWEVITSYMKGRAKRGGDETTLIDFISDSALLESILRIAKDEGRIDDPK